MADITGNQSPTAGTTWSCLASGFPAQWAWAVGSCRPISRLAQQKGPIVDKDNHPVQCLAVYVAGLIAVASMSHFVADQDAAGRTLLSTIAFNFCGRAGIAIALYTGIAFGVTGRCRAYVSS